MAANIVFTRERIRDREEYERYREKARPAAVGHPLKPLAVYGRHETLEGPAIEGAVILEFPTIEAAKSYYQSPAYQEAVRHRFLAPITERSLLRACKAEVPCDRDAL